MIRAHMRIALLLIICCAWVYKGCSSPPCGEETNGLTLCGDKCVDLRFNRSNCGGCGNTCKAGEVCSSGICSLSCQSGFTNCSDKCVDTKTNRVHCGSCGTTCKVGEVCSAGKCALSCQQGLTKCDGSCVNTGTNRTHCGSCGNACKSGEVCSAGTCALSCQQGLTKCGGSCVSIDTNRSHCGSCGNACKAGEVCSAGQCALSCQQGLTKCSDKCVDTKTDRSHCGACGNSCKAGEVCSSGACRLSCQQGLTDCSGNCVSTDTNRSHCGSCGNACKAGEVCSAGKCALSCQQGLTECSSNCVNTQTDRVHCGACGIACKAGEVCSAGKCAPSCQQGLTECSGLCVDTNTNAKHCGKCGTNCPSNSVCRSGKCTALCLGLTLCGNVCKDVQNDSANCGTCGNKCLIGKKCLRGQCVDNSVIGCGSDADCPVDQICSARTNTCQKTIGRECDQSSPCIGGHVCINVPDDQKSYCFQDCTQNPNACTTNTADGRTKCIAFSKDQQGKTISVCLGEAAKGASCAYSDLTQANCKANLFPPLYCSKTSKKCEEAILQKSAGAPCNKAGDISQPLKVCDTNQGLACDANGTCQTASTAKEGEVCDPQGTNLGKRIACATGLLCITFSSSQMGCYRSCDPNRPGSCPRGLTCQALQNSTGACLDTTCTAGNNATCSFPNHTCQNRVCAPIGSAGSVGFGGICSNPVQTKGCKTGLTCLRSGAQTANGFCSQDCTQSNRCPTYKNAAGHTIAASCMAVGVGGSKFCVWPCGQPRQICPDGMVCANAGGTSLCIAR